MIARRLVTLTVLALAMSAPAWGAPPAAAASDERVAQPEWLRQRLEWFQDQRFGLFVHWGIYSQWGCIESWPLVPADTWARPDDLACWVERGKDIERFQRDYVALYRTFRPRHFAPDRWARLAKRAGMRYVVFTTKHHDGFSMFDTRQTDFRVTHPDCPYSRSEQPDIVRAVFDAFRKRGFGIGAYFSKSDWHCPWYWDKDRPIRDRNPNYDTLAEPERWATFVKFVHGQVEELVSNYGPIDILWLDGGQVRPPKQDVRMDALVAMARRHQPRLIVVDRTVGGPHENYRTPEQKVPEKPLPYVWESCLTMGTQWSWKPDDQYKSPCELIHLLVDVVSKGGNLLLNVGPDADGRFAEPAVARLEAIGDWMDVCSEAIHGTRPIAPYKEGRVCLTRKKDGTVCAIILATEGETAPPAEVTLSAPRPKKGATVRMLGSAAPVAWTAGPDGTTFALPASARRDPPCRHAWVLRFEPAGG